LRLLAPTLALDCRGNFRIGSGEWSGKEAVFTCGGGRQE